MTAGIETSTSTRHRMLMSRGNAFRLIWANPVALLGVALFAGFSLASEHFLTIFNLSNILSQSAFVGFLAVGLTPLIVSGEIDLSVGSVVGLSACLAIGLQSQSLAVALICALLAGPLLGLFNGFVVGTLGVNSFIATLAGMIGIRGLSFLYTGDASLSATDDQFMSLGAMTVGPVSLIAILFVVSSALFQWMLAKTIHGRNSYAIGGNRSAAIDAGIPVRRHVTLNFVLCGLMASICGIAMAADLGAATPSYGSDYELFAVTAVVLGGGSLRGGVGNVVGSFAAILTLAILRNGLTLVHVPPFYVPIVMGLALIAGLIFDRRLNRTDGQRSK